MFANVLIRFESFNEGLIIHVKSNDLEYQLWGQITPKTEIYAFPVGTLVVVVCFNSWI